MEICQNGERSFSIGGVDLGADVTGGTGDMEVLDAGERASGRIDLLPELAKARPVRPPVPTRQGAACPALSDCL